MMTELRSLTTFGLNTFREYLDALPTATAAPPVPYELLIAPEMSEGFDHSVEIEQRTFGSRLASAKYLDSVFTSSGVEGIESLPGMWAWLSLFYFEELCPMGKGGRRKPGKDYWLLPEAHAFRYYRHLLAGPYQIYRVFRDEPAGAAIVLHQPLDKPGDYVEQLASRQERISNRGLVEAATHLYFDPVKQKYKRSGQARDKPGTLRRFVDVLEQLELTYDLYFFHESGADLFLELLPQEFKKWK